MEPCERVRPTEQGPDRPGEPGQAGAIRPRRVVQVDRREAGGEVRRWPLLLQPGCRVDRAGETVEAVEAVEPAPERAAGPERIWPIACRPVARRPELPIRVTPLSRAATEACRRLLSAQADAELPGAEGAQSGAAVSDWPGAAGDHVPATLRRRGRALTFIVATALAPGVNRIALPTAVFREGERVDARILSVRSPTGGRKEVTVPDHLRARMFPGARSVVLQFGSD